MSTYTPTRAWVDHTTLYNPVVGGSFFLPGLVCIVALGCYLGRVIPLRRLQDYSGTTFEESVQETKRIVLEDTGICGHFQFAPCVAYNCHFRRFGITDKKTNEVFRPSALTPSALNLYFQQIVGTGKWTISGSRTRPKESTTTSRFFYAIEEGIVMPSGRAYWVERSDKEHDVLVSGTFYNSVSFVGEWLSSSGDRGRVEDLAPAVADSGTEQAGGDAPLYEIFSAVPMKARSLQVV